MSLTVQQLKEKLEMIDKDLSKLKSEPFNDKKISILSEYREYIEDEIRMLENENRSRNRIR